MNTNTFCHKSIFSLESGETLPEFELTYSTSGQIEFDAEGNSTNVIWVCHALTANSNVSDWWEGFIGEGKLYDPKKHFIICANVLGSCYGSTNALSLNSSTGKFFYHQFPFLTIRDIVKALDILRKRLGINKIHTCTGGSMGGQQALEWAIQQPDIFDNLIVMATNAQHSPWGIAFNESQRMAIMNDPTWKEEKESAGLEGMKTARAIALLSYRNYVTYYQTQAEESDEKTKQFKAASYQQYQGEKLKQRFHAFAYWTLSRAMDSHHVGRGRGGIEKALQKIKAKTLAIGIGTDVLFPVSEQKRIAKSIPQGYYKEIESIYGHDGFLIEIEKITKAIQNFYQQNIIKQPQNVVK